MPRCPFAAWKPIGTKTSNARWITPTAIVDHSDAGYVVSLQGWWTNPGSASLSCHFHIGWDGVIEQYVDTSRRAVANVAANEFGISIECSNSPAYRDGHTSFADDSYSAAQQTSLIRLHDWLHATHSTIPRRVCADGVHGVGWHDKFASWTTPGHVCPGATRIRQLQTTIYPATFGRKLPTLKPPEDDMTPEQDARQRRIELRSIAAQNQAGIAAEASTRAAVADIYQARLGRVPDQAGWAAWTTAVTAGSATLDQVDARIARSSEAEKYATAK